MPPDTFSTFIDILRWRAQNQADQTAYTFLLDGEQEDARFTYCELERQARAIGSLLEQLGAGGDCILLLYPPGLDFIAAFFGCLYAGAIAVPAYPPRNARHIPRLQMIAKDLCGKITLVLTTEKAKGRLQKWFNGNPVLSSLQIVPTDTLPPEHGETWQEPFIDEQRLAFLQYTSGSTAQPKGVMVSHRNMIYNSAMIRDCFELTQDSRMVSWLPPYHDLGLGAILQPLFVGFPVILMSPMAFLQRPVRWMETISAYRATISGGPDFSYALCARKITPEQQDKLDLSSWKQAFSGAEPINPETLEHFSAVFGSCGFCEQAFYPCYGLAEATLLVSGGKKTTERPGIRSFQETALKHNQVQEQSEGIQDSRRFVSCGKILPGETVIIVDPESRTQCPAQQIGEIWVAGPSVARGYWNHKKKSKEIFRASLAGQEKGSFLRTGDLGFFQDGELFVTGRLKDLLIIRGRNYYPQDIERLAEQSHPVLRENASAAFSITIEGQERVFIAAEVERRSAREKAENVSQESEYYEVIANIRQAVTECCELKVYGVLLLKIGTIPKTTSGKIQRQACRKGFLEGTLNVIMQWVDDTLEHEMLSPSKAEGETEPHIQPVRSLPVNQNPAKRAEIIQAWLIDHLAEHLKVKPEKIDIQEPFARYGLDSLQAVNLAADLEDWLECKLSPTLVYDYPNIETLSRYLAVHSESTDLIETIQTVRKTGNETIAVIGLGCRFPGAENPQQFWQLLRHGEDAIAEVPGDRWDVEAFYHPAPGTPGKMNTRWGGFIKRVEYFDAQFFGISPSEAENMDPQQRILLEVTWEALENSAYAPDQLGGSHTGVFIGMSSYDYSRFLRNHEKISAYSGTGNALSIAANRLSYILDLHGPSLTVDTACSSSLVAVHQACLSLYHKECDLALAGGVNLILSPETTISLSQNRLLSADGRCKTFDSRADGYARGEGCGMVVLKRLSEALRDGDNILALIRGSAVNQDGRSNGLTAPNGVAQQTVIHQALSNAGVAPAQLSYFEAHGTGTSLGDTVEVNALKEVLMSGPLHDHPCWLGSVKTNVGHLESAAGIAGLIKVILALQHDEIPPHLHLRQLNPHISLEGTPLSIPTTLQAWDVGKDRRIAGVHSCGFGGTNAHIVVEKTLAKARAKPEIERPAHLLTLTARHERALKALARRYATHISTDPDISVPDLCFSANTGRTHFKHRLAIITGSKDQLHEQLRAFEAGQECSGIFKDRITRGKQPKVAFRFTGQGAPYIGMGRQLYETQPTFRGILERCDEILRSYQDTPLLEVLYSSITDHQSFINSQTAIFALEYALAKLWELWGIKPVIVQGDDIGEYAAACIAGAFSLEDGLKLAAGRGHLMQTLKTSASKGHGIEDFKRITEEVSYHFPHKEFISGISGKKAAKEIATPYYWHRHIHQPRHRTTAAEMLLEQECDIVLEIGTGPISSGLPHQFTEHVSENRRLASVRLVPGLRQERSDWQQLLQNLAELYLSGVVVNWEGVDFDYPRHRIALPTYPFQRQRYWISPHSLLIRDDQKPSQSSHPLLGRRFYSALHKNEIQFDSRVNQRSPEFLRHYQVFQKRVFPVSAFLEMVLAAGRAILKTDALVIEDFILRENLIINGDEEKNLQFILNSEKTERGEKRPYSFQIFSATNHEADDNYSWTLHVSGTMLPGNRNLPLEKIDLKAVQSRCKEERSIESWYQTFRQQGIAYGTDFQGISKLWKNQEETLGLLRLPEPLESEITDYQLHPVLLQAAIQVLGTTCQALDAQHDYMTDSVEQIRFYRLPKTTMGVYISTPPKHEPHQDALTFECVHLLHPDGRIIGSIEGLVLKKVRQETLQHSGPSQTIRQQLENAKESERQGILLAYMKNHAAATLGLQETEIETQQPLITMGFDSIMAIEMSNRIQTELAVEVPLEKFIEGLDLEELALYITEHFQDSLAVATENSAVETPPEPQEPNIEQRLDPDIISSAQAEQLLLANLDSLDDEKVEQLLQTLLSE